MESFNEATLIFRNSGEIVPNKNGITFSVNNGKKDFKSVVANNSEDWLRLKLYFDSGKNTDAFLVIRGNSLNLSLGRITWCPVSKNTNRAPKILNKIGAEKVGNISSDFRLRGSQNSITLSEENGKKFYRIFVNAGKSFLTD